jgi:hypothetical protein
MSNDTTIVDPHSERASKLVENRERVENAVGDLYRAFFRLRESGEFQVEYDAMTTLINMLQQDRLALIREHQDEIIF